MVKGPYYGPMVSTLDLPHGSQGMKESEKWKLLYSMELYRDYYRNPNLHSSLTKGTVQLLLGVSAVRA